MTTRFVQTRNEAGELSYHTTIASAMKMAENDPTIWKISWTEGTTGERIRLVRGTPGDRLSGFYYEPIELAIPDIQPSFGLKK
jgi:hypothetical protein